VSFDPAPNARPRWTADGKSVTFIAARNPPGVYQRRADGTGKDSLLLIGQIEEAAFSPDRQWLLWREGTQGAKSGRDIFGVRTGKDTARVPIIVTPADEEAIALSPDGKWIAYQSDETGKTEVFVRSFPNTDGFKRPVSNGSAAAPLWSRDSKELYFLNVSTKDMMAVRVTADGASLAIGAPTKLFHLTDDLLGVEYDYYTPWDVGADGRLILARLRPTAGATPSTIVVTENWFTELKARMKR
jgi:serine/threonine-protein kinase